MKGGVGYAWRNVQVSSPHGEQTVNGIGLGCWRFVFLGKLGRKSLLGL